MYKIQTYADNHAVDFQINFNQENYFLSNCYMCKNQRHVTHFISIHEQQLNPWTRQSPQSNVLFNVSLDHI